MLGDSDPSAVAACKLVMRRMKERKDVEYIIEERSHTWLRLDYMNLLP